MDEMKKSDEKKPNFEVISIEELRDMNIPRCTEEHLREKLKTSKYFYTYTRESTARKIMKDDALCFFIRNIKSMNDPNEADRYGEKADRIYALCFSDNIEESIPMWYLYGGITGRGARIGLTPDKMKKLLTSIEKVYPVNNNSPDYLREFSLKNNDFKLYAGWVYYYDRHSRIRFSKNNKIYSLDKKSLGQTEELKVGNLMIPKTLSENNYFIKDYEWNYEREFRIVFEFDKSQGEQIALFVDRNHIKNGLRVQMGPNFSCSTEKEEDRKERLNAEAHYLHVTQDKISESKLDVQLDLLNRNRSAIAEGITEIADKLTLDEMNKVIAAVSDKKMKLLLREVLEEKRQADNAIHSI